jgi:PKD repeat protein
VSRAIVATLSAAAASVVLAGCTVKKTEVPPLSGPSELGLSLQTTVSPDVLGQDGISQAAIQIVARGPDGRPLRAIPLRVETLVDGVLADYGRLSTRTVVTGDDGIARLTYTSPPPLAEPVDNFVVVTFLITPINGDFANANARSVDIRLVPPGNGVILPPNNPPVAFFTVTPTPVKTYSPVTFDASGTKDENAPCGANCTYAWNFGDGASGSGMTVSHEYRAVGSFTATLTVTDIRGRTASFSQAITVTATDPPKADFVFSPAAPRFGQEVFFNAVSSAAAPGQTIVFYEWDFGTGRHGSGMVIAKRYDVDLIPPGALPGDDVTFNVTLTVSDSTFSPTGVASVTKPVQVKVP